MCIISYQLFIATTVSFEHQTYNVNENDGKAQFILVFSNPLSTAVTVEVFNTDESATGE